MGVDFPPSGATGVPTNVAIIDSDPLFTAIADQVVDESGNAVPLVIDDTALPFTTSSSYIVLRPTSELLPNTTYTIGLGTSSFTTGAGRDDTPPAPPVGYDLVASSGTSFLGCCGNLGPSIYANVDAPPDAVAVAMFVLPVDSEPIYGRLYDPRSQVSVREWCEDDLPAGSYDVMLAAYDAAANLSVLDDTGRVNVGGCTLLGQVPSSSPWLPAALCIGLCSILAGRFRSRRKDS